MGHATFRVGDLEAVIGDNEAYGEHQAGYNGIWSLRHASGTRSVFMPEFAGLSHGVIFDGEGDDSDARFCEECGSALTRTCAQCGRSLSPRAKFCPGCGRPSDASPVTRRSPVKCTRFNLTNEGARWAILDVWIPSSSDR